MVNEKQKKCLHKQRVPQVAHDTFTYIFFQFILYPYSSRAPHPRPEKEVKLQKFTKTVGLAEVKVEVGVLNTSGTKRLLHSNLIVISLLRYPIELFSFSSNNDVISIMMLPFLL